MDSKLWDYLKKPFLVIKKKRTAFTLWVLSTLIAGNFGLVFNSNPPYERKVISI